MPELPEVETIRAALDTLLKGKILSNLTTHTDRLRVPLLQSELIRLKGQKLLGIERRSKYLLWQFTSGWMLIHLGMSGKLVFRKTRCKHDHLEASFGTEKLFYNDPRKFGLITYSREKPEIDTGVEPLQSLFSGRWLFDKLQNRKRDIKNLLLSGKPVCGVGNIYASEALFHAQIHPMSLAAKLSLNQCKSLVKSIKQVLKMAIAAGGTTLNDYRTIEDKPGYFQLKLAVYGREGERCKKCDHNVSKIKQAGRSTFFCQNCQPNE